MDWKLFPLTQSRIDDEERSQKNRVSLDQLFHNLDALLKRDMSDCLSKQLNGLLNNNAKIYQARPSVQRRESRRDYLEAGEDDGNEVNYKTDKESYISQYALKSPKTPVYKPSNLPSKSNRSKYGKSSAVFSSKKPATPPQISPTLSNSKNSDRKGQLKFERLPLTLEGNRCSALPSNGWWISDANGASGSDSETETEAVRETDCNSCLNMGIKSGKSDQSRSFDECSSPDSVHSPFSSEVLNYSSDGAESQTRTGSSPSTLSKIQGMQSEELREARENSSFFHLTSGSGNESGMMDETFVVPMPPRPSPELDDETCQTSSENDSLPCFSRCTSFASDAAMFDDDLELHYKELFRYRSNMASRINYNNLGTFKHNYSRHDKGLIMPRDVDSSQRCFDKSRKITCVFPKVNVSKERIMNNKNIPVVTQEGAVKRRPNTADIPVKLRFRHRSNAFTKFSKVTEENSADERVLPTTLNKSADASYSVMTPYMANVVWSVMDDEKVV